MKTIILSDEQFELLETALKQYHKFFDSPKNNAYEDLLEYIKNSLKEEPKPEKPVEQNCDNCADFRKCFLPESVKVYNGKLCRDFKLKIKVEAKCETCVHFKKAEEKCTIATHLIAHDNGYCSRFEPMVKVEKKVEKKCGNCEYFENKHNCLRYPPSTHTGKMLLNRWCGEFKQKEGV